LKKPYEISATEKPEPYVANEVMCMKFFQVLNFYPSYLEQFYGMQPELENALFADQTASLVADGFGACHTFAPHMSKMGYTPFTAIGNNHRAQLHWLKEQKIPLESNQLWMFEILRKQIDWFKPDILYSADPVTFESGFIRSLTHKPSVTIGFIGSPVPAQIDWSAYDVILSNSTLCLQLAQAAGAKSSLWFWPGVPSFIIEEVKNEQKVFDVVFPGSWSAGHSQRNSLIQTIAATAEAGEGFTPAFFLNDLVTLPDVVAKFNHGSCWGMKMYRVLKQGKIVFNAGLNFGGNEAGNMRAFEATAVGSFLLTEHHDNINQYFEPGVEVETFRSQGELLDKITYYLAHPEKREEIAARGQLRCFRDHIMDRRMEDLDNIIRRHLGLDTGKSQLPEQGVDLYDKAYSWGWSDERLRSTVYLCYKTPDLPDNARRFYDSGEFKAELSMISELGHRPGTAVNVLDIGCGNGIASYSLARSGYNVTGIDSSLGELAGIRAAEQIRGLDGAGFTIKHSASHRLEFPDESFEVVWMREVLHHITDLDSFLREVKRVLKPGGILCCLRDVVIWNEEQRVHFFENHPFYQITHDEGCFYLEEYRVAFEKSGLVTEKELNPIESIINTYPVTPNPGVAYDQAASMTRSAGYDLFSFFLRKPVHCAPEIKNHNVVMEHFLALQKQKEEMMRTASLSPSFIVPCTAKEPESVSLEPDNLEGRFPGVSFGAMIQLLGMKNIAIGTGSCVGDSSWLNVCIRDDRIRLKIGVCVLIGRQAVISTGGNLEIGDYCVFAPRVYISDADHIYTDIMQPILQQGATLNRTVVVEENCWLGINTVISGNLTVGRGSVIGANAVVTRDIPPFSVVVGNPAQIVKMYSPRTRSWERTHSEEDIQRILEERRLIGIPTREEYQHILRTNAVISRLDPILTGRGNLI
jgi:acetyltransferase-like isoleucine patch superfamily enzyme/SAM-dependent methyltransferase